MPLLYLPKTLGTLCCLILWSSNHDSCLGVLWAVFTFLWPTEVSLVFAFRYAGNASILSSRTRFIKLLLTIICLKPVNVWQLEHRVEKVCADFCCINNNIIDEFYAMHMFHIRYSLNDKHFSTGSCWSLAWPILKVSLTPWEPCIRVCCQNVCSTFSPLQQR